MDLSPSNGFFFLFFFANLVPIGIISAALAINELQQSS